HDALRWRRARFVEQVPWRRIEPAGGKSAVGVGQGQERDVRASQGKTVSVEVATLVQRQAQADQASGEGVRRNHQQDPQGGNIQGGRQRRACAHPSRKPLVVVLWNVQSVAGRYIQRAIVQQ